MAIDVPRGFRDSLKALLTASAEEWTAVEEALKTLDVAKGSGGVVSAVRASLTHKEGPIGRLVTLLINTFNEADEEGISAADLARQVAVQCPGVDEGSADAEKLSERLAALYSLHETFGVIAKATSVLLDRHSTYCSSRILTDVRPIFIGSSPPEPQCYAPIHTLRIRAHENRGELKEYFFSLTPSQLAEIGKDISRANDKVKQLQEQFVGARWIQE